MAAKREILCIGEILWDALPLGLFLGGAPFNVACHLHALAEEVTVVSRVGDDVLGREARRRLRARGMVDDLVQVDSSLQTGFVEVSLDESGEPDYVIVEPVAWDRIRRTDELVGRASKAAALVFGTLAQRETVSRETIQTVSRACAGLKVLDVNLRAPFIRHEVVAASLRIADIVKLNADELVRMQRWFDLPEGARASVEALADAFACSVVCVTRGARGAVLWREGAWFEHAGHAVEVKDMVGAGDAFLAALLAGLLRGEKGDEVLDLANRLGAFVATQFGGTPAYEVETLDEIRSINLKPYVG